MPTFHVHLDEAGDFNFSPRGTRHYIFTAAWTYEPASLAQELTSLRFSLLKAGHDLPMFHATRDKQVNRNAVVAALTRHDTWRYASVIVEKAKVYPELRDAHRFYPQFATSVLKYIFHRHIAPGTGTVRAAGTSTRRPASSDTSNSPQDAAPVGADRRRPRRIPLAGRGLEPVTALLRAGVEPEVGAAVVARFHLAPLGSPLNAAVFGRHLQ
ncbi:MAG: hypothetical protein HYY76_14725 [Acidobacteria bacterium]|nr:hypothetical protein [Acidobacteriota bacterium]